MPVKFDIFLPFFRMGNIEGHFEQANYVCHLIVLDRYISNENILFVTACTQCFGIFKKNCLEASSFMLNIQKMAEKG